MRDMNKAITRVLVTGGSGFIGANLVRTLLDRRYQVTVLDNLSTGRKNYLAGLDIDFVEADILDSDRVHQLLSEFQAVVHLAAQAGVPRSVEDPLEDFEINARGTLLLLEAARRVGIHRFVFASSNAPLGRQSPPSTEEKAPLPMSPYGASKLAGEGYCMAYHGSWGLGTVVLRFANVYGPFSGHNDSVVSSFFKKILAGEELTIYDAGDQTRDFIYVSDLCEAIVLALESQVGGELFQVATGTETSISGLAAIVQEMVSGDVEQGVRVSFAPPRPGDIHKNYSDIRKIRALLQWEPSTVLSDGLLLTWNWFRQNRGHILTAV